MPCKKTTYNTLPGNKKLVKNNINTIYVHTSMIFKIQNKLP